MRLPLHIVPDAAQSLLVAPEASSGGRQRTTHVPGCALSSVAPLYLYSYSLLLYCIQLSRVLQYQQTAHGLNARAVESADSGDTLLSIPTKGCCNAILASALLQGLLHAVSAAGSAGAGAAAERAAGPHGPPGTGPGADPAGSPRWRVLRHAHPGPRSPPIRTYCP